MPLRLYTSHMKICYVGIFGGEESLQWEENGIIMGKWKIKLVFLYLKSFVFSITISSQFYTIST